MLHFAILANVLNAIGGQPEFDKPEFVPIYPDTLPLLGTSQRVWV